MKGTVQPSSKRDRTALTCSGVTPRGGSPAGFSSFAIISGIFNPIELAAAVSIHNHLPDKDTKIIV